MIDLETLDVVTTAQILSIGAAKFKSSGIIDTFYTNLRIKEGEALGFSKTKETLQWWATQRSEVISAAIQNAVGYEEGIDQFLDWYGDYSMPTWSNGADFDIPILKHHFNVLGKTVPWKYRDTRCYRTVAALLGDMIEINRSGLAHCSKDDAVSQANHLIQLLK